MPVSQLRQFSAHKENAENNSADIEQNKKTSEQLTCSRWLLHRGK